MVVVVNCSLDGLRSIEVTSSLSAIEEWRLEEEEAICRVGAVPVKRLAEVVEVVTNPVFHELVTSIGEASVVRDLRVPVVVVTLGG